MALAPSPCYLGDGLRRGTRLSFPYAPLGGRDMTFKMSKPAPVPRRTVSYFPILLSYEMTKRDTNVENSEFGLYVSPGFSSNKNSMYLINQNVPTSQWELDL